MQSTLRAFLALVVLCWIGAASPSVLQAQPAPPPVSILSAAGDVRALIARLDAVTARIRAHQFAPVYYAEPCEPTKQEGEASLAPYRRELRALRVEAERLEAEIRALERNSSNKLIMAENGWDYQNLKRWRPLENALNSAFGALSAAEARLDAMPVKPCPRPSTPSTQPPVDGPTSADVELLKDFPGSPLPRFDEPLIPPVPPKSFCTHTERLNWLRNVFWPFYERAKANSVAAISHFNALERRMNEISYAEGMESPRYKAAERFVKAYAPIKKKHMDFQTEVLKIHDAASNTPVISCDPPTETTPPPTTPVTPVTPAGPVTPPVTDGPVAPPRPPLPPGVSAPQLERVRVPTLPDRFCSEQEKLAFLVDVYHPAAEAASKNALKTSAYRKLLSDLIYEATVRRDQATADALKQEYEAFKPTAEAADALQVRMMRMRDEILRIPVVDCTPGRKKPVRDPLPQPPPPPPVTDGSVTTPTPPPPPAPPAKPKMPPPNLNRPQFERVSTVTPPASFCSEFERNDFLVDVYNPAVAAALANAQTATAHETKLNGMFTEYMRGEGGAGWAAVKAEQAEYRAIAEAARAEATRLQGLYARILAVPIKPCPTETAPPPPPTTPATPATPVTPVPVDGPAVDIFDVPAETPPAIPSTFCDEAERQALAAQLQTMMERVDGRMDKASDAIEALESMREALRQAGRTADAAALGEPIQNLYDRLDALIAQWNALWSARDKLDAAVVKPCPPPGEGPTDGPATTPQTPPQDFYTPQTGFKDFEWPPVPDAFCNPNDLIQYVDQLKALHAAIDAEADRLEALSRLLAAAHYGSLALNQHDYDRISLLAPDLGAMLEGGRGFFYFSLRARIEDKLDYYDEFLEDLEDEIDDVSRALRRNRFTFDCPPPADDGPVTQPGGVKEPCPPKTGRTPIIVGPNSKVGSGAQLRSKLGGMATGALMGALGVGGGGGGSPEPQLWTCRIKDSEMTVFDDAATGVSLRVGAKRDKSGKLVIFSDIAKSPDKGTFQTAFLERPSTGETLAPSDVGPCDLWGEWKLTVSWTKTTYVNGQVVDHQSGGWSEGGFFKIPGALSRVDAPDGLWKRMGFSGAQMGARKIATIFDLPSGSGPMTFVIHVTRPKGDPVTTVPFVLTLTEGPGGVYTITKAEDPPCPPETVGSLGGQPAEVLTESPRGSIVSSPTNTPSTSATGGGTSAPTGGTTASGPTTTTTTPPTTGLDALPKPPTGPDQTLAISDLKRLETAIGNWRDNDFANRKALDAARCKGPEAWKAEHTKYLKDLRDWLGILQIFIPYGPDRGAIQDAINAEMVRVSQEILDAELMTPPPAPKTCPPGEDTEVDSILDEITEVTVIG